MVTVPILLEVRNLVKYFPVVKGIIFSKKASFVRAVDGVNLSIRKGDILGLVGESGCGKSTLARLILRLIESTSGDIYFEGENILKLDYKQMHKVRRNISMIFQDPYGSLNPRKKISHIIGEPLLVQGLCRRKEIYRRVRDLMEIIGLDPSYGRHYPHELSGGQRQRVGIARALVIMPKIIVCDEPTSALDVSIQAKIINLLKDLQKRFSLTYLFISHDLSVVKYISDRVAVMYLGKLVEIAEKNLLFSSPLHPYTKALLSTVPVPDPTIKKEHILLKGEIPTSTASFLGCRFQPRCFMAEDICEISEPELIDVGNEHYVACHRMNR